MQTQVIFSYRRALVVPVLLLIGGYFLRSEPVTYTPKTPFEVGFLEIVRRDPVPAVRNIETLLAQGKLEIRLTKWGEFNNLEYKPDQRVLIIDPNFLSPTVARCAQHQALRHEVKHIEDDYAGLLTPAPKVSGTLDEETVLRYVKNFYRAEWRAVVAQREEGPCPEMEHTQDAPAEFCTFFKRRLLEDHMSRAVLRYPKVRDWTRTFDCTELDNAR